MFVKLKNVFSQETALIWVQLPMAFYFVFVMYYSEKSVLMTIGANPLPNTGFIVYFPIAVLGVSAILPRRTRWIFPLMASVCLSIFTAGDHVYFTYFQTLPSLKSGIPILQSLAVWKSVVALLGSDSAIILLTPIPLLIYSIISFRVIPKNRFDLLAFIQNLLLGLSLIIASAFLYVHALNKPITEKTHHLNKDSKKLPGDHWGSNFSNVEFAKVMGITNFHIKDITRKFAEETSKKNVTDDKKEMIKEVINSQVVDTSKSPLFGIAKNFNIIIVQVESMQHWVINHKIEGTEVTPFLNRAYREEMHFDKIYDTTGVGRTSDAEFAIFRGLAPDMEFSSAFYHADKDLYAFPKHLKSLGYSTASYHGFKKDFWNRTITHPVYGFDKMTFLEDLEHLNLEKVGLGLSDKAMYNVALNRILERPQPSLSYIISLTSHHPYNIAPKEVSNLFHNQTSKANFTFYYDYLKLMRYCDNTLHHLYKKIKDSPIGDNTIFVVFGDHDLGNISENSLVGKVNVRIAIQQLGLNPFDAAKDKVPLLIFLPEKIKSQIKNLNQYSNTAGTLCDLFPTLFHLIGQEPAKGILGSTLFRNEGKFIPLPFSYNIKQKQYEIAFLYQNNFYKGPVESAKSPTDPESQFLHDFIPLFQKVKEANELIIRNDLQKELFPRQEQDFQN